MVTWKEFAAAEADLAEVGRSLLFQFKVGLAFLATARKDGAPRLHVDKILKGAKVGELPVEQPTRLRMVVNLGTAHALGLTIPQSILLSTDEVIR